MAITFIDDSIILPSYHNEGTDSATLSESSSIAITTYIYSSDFNSTLGESSTLNVSFTSFDNANLVESLNNSLDDSDFLAFSETFSLTIDFSSEDSATLTEKNTFFWDSYDSAVLSEQVFVENSSVDSAILNESSQVELSNSDIGTLSEFANNINLSNSDSAVLAEALSLIVDTTDTSTLFEFIDKIDLYSVIDTSALSDLVSINMSANSADSLTVFEDNHFDAETPQEDFLTVHDLPFISVNIATSDDPTLIEDTPDIALFVYDGISLSETTFVALSSIDNGIFTDNRNIVVDANSSDVTYSINDSSSVSASIVSNDTALTSEQNYISANINASDNANQTEILQIFLFSNDFANLNEGINSISQSSNDLGNVSDQNLGLYIAPNVDNGIFSENEKFIEISSRDIESIFSENPASIVLSSQDSEIFEELVEIGVSNSDSANLIEKLINSLDAQDSATTLEFFQNTANLQGQDLYIFADLGNASVAKFGLDSIFAVESASSIGLNVIQLITFKEGRTGIGKAGVINILINTNPTNHGTAHGPVIYYGSGTTTHGTAQGSSVTISTIGGTVPILL